MKKTLLATLISLPLIFSSCDTSKNATGTLEVKTGEFDIPIYAKVSFIRENSKDTISYNTALAGRVNYEVPTNSPTRYKILVEPGEIAGSAGNKGDKFEPFSDSVTVYPGQNKDLKVMPN
ncbi:MAG: hypothetical protein KC516_00345 [Nanoarchaeota archaeon]|nr:hypothetical protein [Nanoarchaeota archaeon]